MSSHFSDIGFKGFTEDNFYKKVQDIVEGNIKHAARIELYGTPYLVVPVDNVIELWFPFEDNTLDPYSVSLHYKTTSFLEVTEVEQTKEEGGGHPGLYSVKLPDCYPLNVTVPAEGLVAKMDPKKTYKCQVACFAETVTVYKDADDFHKNNEYGETMGEKCFIPSGTFNLNDEEGELSSQALINGEVVSFEARTNTFTKNTYYFVTVETFGGRYDLLLDPDDLQKPLEKGNIISGSFYLTGKFMSVFKGDELVDYHRLRSGDERLQTLGDLYHILRNCWSKETAYPSCQDEWNKSDCTFGQCAITAMLVYDMFGGSIHKVRNDDGSTHYFNKIDGHYVDLTSEQFELYYLPVDYEKGIVVDRAYCGKNSDTKKRYDLLVRSISEYLKQKSTED